MTRRAGGQERDDAIRAVAQERARVGELEQALAARVEVEAQLRQALDAVNSELSEVRAGDGERAAKLAARVESVVALATGLRDGVRRELGRRAGRADRVAGGHAGARGRAAGRRRGGHGAARGAGDRARRALGRRVRAGRRAPPRRRGPRRARLRRAAAGRRRGRARGAPRRRPTAPVPDPTALASLRAALEHLQAPAAGERDAASTPSLGLDLAAAAERLRATVAATEDADGSSLSPSRDGLLEALEVVEPLAPSPEATRRARATRCARA